MADKVSPKRRFQLLLDAGADTREDMISVVQDVLRHLRGGGPADTHVVSGGCSTGHILTITEDPEITHESFRHELDAYLGRETPAR